MLRRAITVSKETRAFQRDIDAQLGVRQVGRVALGGDAHALAIDNHRVAIRRNLARKGAVNAVAFEQQRVRLGVGKIVDRPQFETAVRALEAGARYQATDASETVDCVFPYHVEGVLSPYSCPAF